MPNPPLSALFLVTFDQKVGYTITWHRSRPESLPLAGVEFSALPSGLHDVPEDLVLFWHDRYVGVSAYRQREAGAGQRGADFLAVGALVEREVLGGGGEGRKGEDLWALGEVLAGLVEEVYRKEGGVGWETGALEDFWAKEGKRREGKGEEDRGDGVEGQGEEWSAHPALDAEALLDTFGPLVFPLWREVLLRRRVLLLGHPPVRRNCSVVQLLWTLSALQSPTPHMLPDATDTLRETLPLFSVGIHDIPFLEQQRDAPAGWLACTTDSILRDKRQLYDVLVDFPATSSSSNASWPSLQRPDGTPLKASQRDLRRYNVLHAELGRIRLERHRYRDDPLASTQSADHDNDSTPLLPDNETRLNYPRPRASFPPTLIEPPTWTATAYAAFSWWAAAADTETWESDEAASDARMLDNAPAATAPDVDSDEASEQRLAAGVVGAFFRAFARRIFGTLEGVFADADGGGEGEAGGGVEEEGVLVVSADDVRAMGLDPWSAADAEVVREMMKVWFGRAAEVGGGEGVWVCGMRVC